MFVINLKKKLKFRRQVYEEMITSLADISPATAALCVTAISIAIIFIAIRVGHNLIYLGPGPWGVPLLGFYPFIREDFYAHLSELGGKYGDLYLFSMCGKRFLHIGSLKALREVFLNKSDCLGGRCVDFSIFQYLFEGGLTFMSDEPWKVWRKFLVQSMRELGIGFKETTKGILLSSVQATLESLKQSYREPVDIGALMTYQCTDVVRKLMLGNNVSDETVLKLNEMYLKSNSLTGGVQILLAGKIARYLVLPWNKAFHQVVEGKKEVDKLLFNILNDHKVNFDPQHTEDFIDLYLREKQMREKKNGPQAKYFTDKALIGTLVQIYGDGSLVVGGFLTYHLRELATKVDIQNAIYKEIVDEIGTERLPTYEDRIKLPFTCSVLKEIERKSVFFPVIPTVEFICDTTVSNVFVPKGTMTAVNLYSIHNDPSVYKNPEQFDPKRFLQNEELKTELPVSLGIGKRSCAGESLIMVHLFTFVTAIIQHFTLRLELSDRTGDQPKEADYVSVLDCKFLVYPRKNH